MALSILPTATELAALTTLEQIRAWTQTPTETWRVASDALGTVPSIRVLALTPADIFRQMLRQVRIPVTGGAPRELGSVEAIQLALMWRVSRQAYQLEDLDILAPGALYGHAAPAAAVVPSPKAASSSGVKRLKVSNFVDQLDDTEVDMASKVEIDEAYRCFREATGADPQPEADPTPEQIAVMRAKVVVNGEAPYGDFSVLTPYGRRVQKSMKAKNWLLQADGSFKAQEVPGPPTFEAWRACWRVYRSVLLMLCHEPTAPGGPKLPVVTVACLEEYYDKVKELADEFPEAWHLVMIAEDRCRGEYFERLRRTLRRARLEGRLPMGLDFQETRPWIGVFTQAARDAEYWQKHVIRPAQSFLARGGAGKSMPKDVANDVNMTSGAQAATSHAAPGEGLSRNARKRRAAKEKLAAEKAKNDKWQSEAKPGWNGASPGAGPSGGGGGGAVHPRKFGQTFITTREGTEICYRFAKGAANACAEPCADKRAHVCQYCLGVHTNQQCPNRNKEGGKAKGRGK